MCPSHIPLVDYFRFSKSEIWARERDKSAADTARDRFEFKNFRQEREKQEKAEKLAAKAAATREKVAGDAATGAAAAPAKPGGDDAKRALIEAAMEKARQQKAQAAPKNTEVADPAIQAEIAAIDARREAAAKAAQGGEATPPAPGA